MVEMGTEDGDRLTADIKARALELARKDAGLEPDHIARLVLDQIRGTETWRAFTDMLGRSELYGLAAEAHAEAVNERTKGR